MITDCMPASDVKQNSLQICSNLHMGYFWFRVVPWKSDPMETVTKSVIENLLLEPSRDCQMICVTLYLTEVFF